jgi:hypothetical protein
MKVAAKLAVLCLAAYARRCARRQAQRDDGRDDRRTALAGGRGSCRWDTRGAAGTAGTTSTTGAIPAPSASIASGSRSPSGITLLAMSDEQAWWEVAALEPERFLGLRASYDLRGRPFDPTGARPRFDTDSLWGFQLEELAGGRTRLV